MNGLNQSRPGRLELQDTGTASGLASSSAAEDAVSSTRKLTSSDCSTVAIQSSSSSKVTVSTSSGNESNASKIGNTSATRPQCGNGNSVTEVNGNPELPSLSDCAITSGIELPSPPPTPPTAKSRLCDSRQIVLPSPARNKSQRQDGRKNSTPDSVDLPPPPSPPLQFCQRSSLDSPGGVLPPPPLDDSLYTIPPRVSPPPPMSPASSAVANLITSTAASKTVASGSEMSTFAVEPVASLVDGLSALSDMMSGFEGATHDGDGCETVSSDQALVRDTRSDLLAAIREGTVTALLPLFDCMSYVDLKPGFHYPS